MTRIPHPAADPGKAAVRWPLACVLLPCLLMSACSTVPAPISFSIEQLGAEAASRSDGELGFRSAVSVTGITPPYAAGTLLSVPGRGLPDLFSVPITTTCSRILETTYESEATQGDVLKIASAIESLRSTLLGAAVAEGKLRLVANARALLRQPAPQPGSAQALQLQTLASALGVDKADDATLDTMGQALQKEIDEAKQKTAESTRTIVGLQQKSNLFIFRWALDAGKGASLSVGTAASAAASSSDKRSGYLVAASLRAASLEYGDDLVTKLLRDRRFGGTGADAVLQNTYIVNYTLGARHLYFSEDRDLAFAIGAALKLSAAELDQIFGGAGWAAFLKTQSLAIEATLKSSISASARGLVSQPSRKAYPFRMWGDAALAAGGSAERERNDQYVVFYSTRSDIATFKLDQAKEMEGAAAFQCFHMVPESGALWATSIERTGYRYCLPKGWNTDEGRKARGREKSGAWAPDTTQCIDFSQALR